MTLIEDLEVASVDAEMLGDDLRAVRLRASAARLREEMEECARAAAQPSAAFERADLRLYERINGGPL